ncbi:MAG: hypothetical protein ACQEUZ_00700 [Pseudomonadota bacterium]
MSPVDESAKGLAGGLTSEEVRRICGDIPDWKLAQIVATGADVTELEEAVAWASGDDETTPDRHLAPGGAAARIYDILTADEEYDDRY